VQSEAEADAEAAAATATGRERTVPVWKDGLVGSLHFAAGLVQALPTDTLPTFPSSNPEYRLPSRSSAGYHVSVCTSAWYTSNAMVVRFAVGGVPECCGVDVQQAAAYLHHTPG
jgi:hypothetical protein